MQQFINILALLACPLMMLLCMKGMFGGSKKSCHKDNHQNDLSQKVDMLVKQNMELQKELNEIKNQGTAGQQHNTTQF